MERERLYSFLFSSRKKEESKISSKEEKKKKMSFTASVIDLVEFIFSGFKEGFLMGILRFSIGIIVVPIILSPFILVFLIVVFSIFSILANLSR